jgi:beta-glucosidase
MVKNLLSLLARRGVAAAFLVATAIPSLVSAVRAEENDARVEALLGRMTLAEKIGQLNLMPNEPGFRYDAVENGLVGAVIGFTNAGEVSAVEAAGRRSRLGIPLLIGLDVIHGLRTMFPMPLAEAASFDPPLAKATAEMAARESVAIGLNWTFGPVADTARDARWGRMVEGFGEDVLLGRAFTAARVQGFHAGGLATTLKHFAGYGAAVGGRDYDVTDVPTSTLFDLYLPPFRAGIEAGSESVMGAFSALNGLPATASADLMTGILRGRLGFQGFTVSDWFAIQELIDHGVARNDAEAARKALIAGIDMDMSSGVYAQHLAQEVESGRLPVAAVDQAARRVLRTKQRMGLLDSPPFRPDTAKLGPNGIPPPPSDEARALARRAAQDTIVVLRNDGVLPLRDKRRMAVLGGMASSKDTLSGPHAALVRHDDAVTILDGLTRRAAQAGAEVVYAAGCDVECVSDQNFEAAVAAVRDADVAVVTLGEPVPITGEGASRARLDLPDRQAAFLDRIVAAGTPVGLVLLSSRPVELGPVVDRLAGLVMAWYPGTEGGNALADILFGDADPSAKLPITWPRLVGQVPLNYDRLPSGRPHDPQSRFTLRYADEKLSPLYPFGFGLTYARFTFSDLAIKSPRLPRSETLEASVRIANTSDRPGREVAQLYVRQLVASRSRPLRKLAAFEKVSLAPGETKTVTFRVPVETLGFHDDTGAYVIEPGPFQVFAGNSSDAGLSAGFEVVAD